MRFLRTLPLLLLAAPLHAQMCGQAEVLYYNGHILTGNALNTPSPEWATAIAITNGHIIRVDIVGKHDKAARACGGTQAIDLHGAFVMPGFNDAHTHIANAGQNHLTVNLDNVPSLAAMQSKIKDYAATLPTGQWILGGGWDHTKWDSKTLPTRQDMDSVSAGHPVMLSRTDEHIVIANTAALAAAGITDTTPDPAGGKIDRDAQGHATGIVRESPAIALLRAHIPPPTTDQRRRALQASIQDALAHGVTSVQDLSSWDDFLVLESLERDNQLHLRVSEWLTFNDPIETLKAHQASHDKNDPMLHTGMLKGFMDGSLGSRTAALAAPYADDPKNSGLPRYNQAALNKLTSERAEAGFQLGFHAIGDRANTMALNAFDIAKTERMKMLQKMLPQLEASTHAHISVTDQSRYRIEHAQVLLPADFDRFAHLHIIASMQPSHLLTDMAWATDRLGPNRAKYAYAWRSFLNHNVTLAFGTDYPVESISPFRGLYSAVTRQNEAGTQTFQPKEKLTIAEAIYAYTQGSAFAENMEKQKGRLEPGFLADLVVLDRDITKASPQDLLHTKVLRTIVNGATVYTAPESPSTQIGGAQIGGTQIGGAQIGGAQIGGAPCPASGTWVCAEAEN